MRKPPFVLDLTNGKTLSNIMRVGIENIPVTKFDSRTILKGWLKQVSNILEDTKQKTRKN